MRATIGQLCTYLICMVDDSVMLVTCNFWLQHTDCISTAVAETAVLK